MADQDLSIYDIEMLYGQFQEKQDFDKTFYHPALSGLYPLEEYFSEKKKKNKCAWIKIDEHGCCGKPCKDIFCNKYLLMRLRGCRIPLPCLVCGVGVINFEFICTACSLEKETKQRSLLLAKEFENNDDWHEKNSGTNVSGS